MAEPKDETEAQWRELLTEEQYRVTRQKGTERAFTGRYWDHHAKGEYRCVCCQATLFSSSHKYDSGSGWPSFWQPIADGRIAFEEDDSLMMRRIEATCHDCGAHLGHVFDDGPQPSGKRYCINSASLAFVPDGD